MHEGKDPVFQFPCIQNAWLPPTDSYSAVVTLLSTLYFDLFIVLLERLHMFAEPGR